MSQGISNINAGNMAASASFASAGVARSSMLKIIKETRASMEQSRTETLEDLSIVMGKLRNLGAEHAEKDKKTKIELRETLFRISESLPLDGDVRHMFSQLEAALEHSDNKNDLMRFLLQIFHDPAIVALVVQSYLTRRKKNQKRLSELLDDIVISMGEDTSVLLFGALHFGAGNKEIKQKINSLYHETAKEFASIVAFYKKLKKQFRRSRDRKKAILCLMHSYAEDMHDSSNELFKIKIIHVIKELKRLSTMLGMDEECAEIASFMSDLPGVKRLSSDNVMDSVVEWLDTIWIYTEMVSAKLEELSINELSAQIVFMQKMVFLFRHLPENCFEEEENRSHIVDVLQQKVNTLALEEESL